MGHAAAFYALVPPERLQPIHRQQIPRIRAAFAQTKAMPLVCQLASHPVLSSHMLALVSSVTLTESALSSPRAAAPGAAAFSRSARARSFFNRPAFTPLCSRLAYPAATALKEGRGREEPAGAFRR